MSRIRGKHQAGAGWIRVSPHLSLPSPSKIRLHSPVSQSTINHPPSTLVAALPRCALCVLSLLRFLMFKPVFAKLRRSDLTIAPGKNAPFCSLNVRHPGFTFPSKNFSGAAQILFFLSARAAKPERPSIDFQTAHSGIIFERRDSPAMIAKEFFDNRRFLIAAAAKSALAVGRASCLAHTFHCPAIRS